jgi:hypothetical protein
LLHNIAAALFRLENSLTPTDVHDDGLAPRADARK